MQSTTNLGDRTNEFLSIAQNYQQRQGIENQASCIVRTYTQFPKYSIDQEKGRKWWQVGVHQTSNKYCTRNRVHFQEFRKADKSMSEK